MANKDFISGAATTERLTAHRPTYDQLTTDPATSAGVAWSVFATNPYRGTLNLITPEKILAAAQCIHSGKVFSLNWEITRPNPSLFHRKLCKHTFFNDPDSTDDYLDHFYLQGSSHWDALCHVHHPARGHYLGLKAITRPQDNPIGVDQYAKQGIVGRGVLADVARFFEQTGRHLRPLSSDTISLDDLKQGLAWQGTELEEGDVLLYRSGWMQAWRTIPDFRHQVAREPMIPGLAGAAEVAKYLWDSGIAALACDNPTVEVFPFESDTDNLHHRLVVNLGMPLGEMFDLDALAAACHEDRRYEFLFCAAPLNLPGGAGSPANALAIR